MHCDDVRSRLLERLDLPGSEAPLPERVEAHLETCADCMALHLDIGTMAARARVWHELSPPPWNRGAAGPGAGAPAMAARTSWSIVLGQWFPVLASSAALLLAAAVYRQAAPDPTDAAPQASALPTATGGAPVDIAGPAAEQLLATSRRERKQELEALSALLQAEMDRRTLETEESLKYIISHQIQSQRQLEALRGQLQQTGAVSGEQL